MSNIPDKTHFENAYKEKAPWDIPGPQPAFGEVAGQITGSILDAGCGTGENSLFFAERGNGVTGIDYVQEPIRRANQKAAERGLSATFLVMDALALTKLQQLFENVIDCGLFHCFSDDDRQKYVEGLAGVLNTEGRLFLMCFSDAEPGTFGPRRNSKAELRAAFADGWEIESISPKRIQTIPEFKDQFSEGGPKAWLVIVRRV
jgi:cyclopropane fatty-acyl-phospholipid synthase-like methyltransferase